MRRIVLAEIATKQLGWIYEDSISTWGHSVAESYSDLILSTLDLLSEHPGMGTLVEEGLEYRRFLVNLHPGSDGHWIVYRFDQDVVRVLRFVHTKLDFEKYLTSKVIPQDQGEPESSD